MERPDQGSSLPPDPARREDIIRDDVARMRSGQAAQPLVADL